MDHLATPLELPLWSIRFACIVVLGRMFTHQRPKRHYVNSFLKRAAVSSVVRSIL